MVDFVQNQIQQATSAPSAASVTAPQGYFSNMGATPSSQYYQYVQPQSNSGGSSGGGLLDLASQGKSSIDFLSGKSFGGVNSAVNSFGSSLGFASGATAPTYLTAGAMPWQTVGAVANPSYASGLLAAGPSNVVSSGASTAGSLSTATLGQTLGAAGIGAFAGNFLGKIGGNSTGGSIGGAIGAGIGMAFGPPGAILGGLIGGIGGGFFGSKSKPTQADTYYTFMAPDGTLSYRDSGSKNPGQFAGFGKSIADEFGQLSSSLSKDLGIQFEKDSRFSSGISTLHGGAYVTDNKTNQIFFDYKDEASKRNAYLEALKKSAQNSGYTNMEAIDKWFQSKSMNGGRGTPNIAPATTPPASQFKQFVEQYKAQQNANAAPSAA